MLVTSVLLRWYRSFNVMNLGPADLVPGDRWHTFRGQQFPFISVPIDRFITTVVGANESGKSHLLSAIIKVLSGAGISGKRTDEYEIKDICRYCGFSALDEIWPQIGVELAVTADEAALFENESPAPASPDKPSGNDLIALTIILDGADPERFATVYRGSAIVRTFARSAWQSLADSHFPRVAVLESELALPNEIHIDELLDLYADQTPRKVVDSLAVQDLWREIEPVEIISGGAVDAATAQRVQQLKGTIARSARTTPSNEHRLVYLFFSGVLGVRLEQLERVRRYTNSERGYVSWMNDELNNRIDRELDVSRYWDQDEDFRVSMNYKSGTFHFQITDRTGSTYTFNERSSGLRYFLSYYIQAKALERGNHDRGVLILMDEPDNFLSASAQRSLLRVFENLVSTKSARGNCQLIYTTHSPFLINRNFPGRIRLVRKGDGSEGTQYVPRPHVRRFEPVRSALSIDCADTLFLGSTNVVVEGLSDQKLIVACIQRFGLPGQLDELLDLNKITFVSAGGAPYAPNLVRKAVKGDERPPVVVVVLDGDEPGERFAIETAKVIDPRQVCTLKEVTGIAGVWIVLEDAVPASLLDAAVHRYAATLGAPCGAKFDTSLPGSNNADKLVAFCAANIAGLSAQDGAEIRAGVVDSLVDLLEDQSFHMADLDDLSRNIKMLCGCIRERIEIAERNAGRSSLKKIVRLQIETFVKRFPLGASKADLGKLLRDVKQSAFGHSDDFEQTRNNVDALLERLDAEARQNSDSVDIRAWHSKLQRFKNEPWARVRDWSAIAAPSAATPARPDRAPGDGSPEITQ